MHIIGRGRYAREAYPERSSAIQVPPAFVFYQASTGWHQIAGAATIVIASATITLQAGSRVKIEALAPADGSVAAGRMFIQTDAPGTTSVLGSQSFGTATQDEFRTCNYLAVSDPQPGGPLTVNLQLTVNGNGGARIDESGLTVLTLTEILAP
jgi:hypothetical protein